MIGLSTSTIASVTPANGPKAFFAAVRQYMHADLSGKRREIGAGTGANFQ